MLQEKTKITTERVLAEYAKIAFSNLTDIIDYASGTISIENFKNLTPEQKHSIKKIKFVTVDKIINGKHNEVEKVEIELHDKAKGLDSLARHLGMFDSKAGVEKSASLVYNITLAGEEPKDE